MKRTIISAIVALSVIALVAIFEGFTPSGTRNSLQVSLPVLPLDLEFAGERVPLENYDTRESLMRELLVTQNMHSRTAQTLMAASRYFPIIEPILQEQGVPLDFRFLCMAESSLNPNVVSVVGAAGLWQLMPAVGRQNGMVVGPDVDERYHIEKATVAACAHLKESYERFGSWTLAAAAYNLGNEGVARRLARQHMDNYYDMFLPEETLRYMFRILSMKLVYKYPKLYGYHISEPERYRPLTEYKIVVADSTYIDWSDFAIANGTTYKMLRELNHWIRDYDYNNKEGRSFDVKVPLDGFRKVGR